MPNPLSSQSIEGRRFFSNDADGSGRLDLDPKVFAEMESDTHDRLYGGHFVAPESAVFLKMIEAQLGREWIEDNIGVGRGMIELDDAGNIVYFNCSNTDIRVLPELPVGLEDLYCFNTSVATLPQLPAKLRVLSCSNTTLSKDPVERARITDECRKKGIHLSLDF